MQHYLRNTWYVAGWSHEVPADKLFQRTLLGSPVVMYRDSDGRLRALQDRCPHRFAPLHTGVLVGNAVQCPYHGLRFGADGSCVHNPHGDGSIPRAARVRSYPVVELDTLIWLWAGDPAQADTSMIPRYPELLDPPGLKTLRGHFNVDCDYRVEMDNLMDLTHVEYLHKDSLGSSDLTHGQHEVKQEGDRTVHSNRWFDCGEPSPLAAQVHGMVGQKVEAWANMRWEAPANLYLDTGLTPTGHPRSEGHRTISLHLLTPEHETRTHYFFSITRDQHLDSPGVDQMLLAGARQAFECEDKPLLEAVQRRMGTTDLWSLKPVLLPIDAGAVRARRVLEQLIHCENAADTPQPA